jgi:hypothetical protein
MHEEEADYQLDRLMFKDRLLSAQLQDLALKIDKLESNHLSRWHSGNLYLSFHPHLHQTKRRLLDPPAHAKLFSTSDALSAPATQLQFRNRRIVPVEVERHLEKERVRLNRRRADRARQAHSDSSSTQKR